MFVTPGLGFVFTLLALDSRVVPVMVDVVVIGLVVAVVALVVVAVVVVIVVGLVVVVVDDMVAAAVVFAVVAFVVIVMVVGLGSSGWTLVPHRLLLSRAYSITIASGRPVSPLIKRQA